MLSLESSLDSKEIKRVNPKGNQLWIFMGRIDAEDETPILWPPDGKSWLTVKDSDAGKDKGQGEKGTAEDEMVRWHHWLNGHGFRWTPGVGDGQGGLTCCGPWVYKESDRTERLNWTEAKRVLQAFKVYKVITYFILSMYVNNPHLNSCVWTYTHIQSKIRCESLQRIQFT